MSNKLTRAVVVTAAAGLLATGMSAAAGSADAAPGDLRVVVDAKCVSSHGRAATDRIIYVRNVGDTTVRNIRLGEVNGPEVGIPALRRGQETRPRTVGGNRWYSSTGVRRANQLAPRESVKYWHVVPGCNGPWMMAGYATANPMDDVFNAPNGDLRWSFDRPLPERN